MIVMDLGLVLAIIHDSKLFESRYRGENVNTNTGPSPYTHRLWGRGTSGD